ncbi:TylF/MycF/NovP-related O-methyltransferase [Pseudoalteromonas xiamenensis]|uniref:TylF/MycF/NovP-related O-methyltransferase n=1 Tax=Pseudoalteromonas xiamenensis TaxID=882626 RepID=UPI00244DD6CC|nr:TylF/MycF/NovP-related O-methyltransferase [Pseudoalteromonas xiamenensis]
MEQEVGFSNFEIHKGWFSETMPQLKPKQLFSLVHLDCDLYQSTYDALEYLFSHQCLPTGSVLMFDDWSCNKNSPLYGQQKAWADIVEKFNVQATDRGYYGIGSHVKVIIDYTK